MLDLNKYLSANTFITADELKELEQLAVDYPWFSLSHQIVLMGYKQHKSEKFNDKCRETAVYTLNRKRLYNILEKAGEYTQPETLTDKPEKQPEQLVPEIVNPVVDNAIHDDLLLNFSHEYFTIEDLDPIEIDDTEETNDDLISKFISDNPRIIPNTASISDLDNLIQIDESFEDEPLSETLAEIYASQGLYEQAISTYEKLSLLNPEKSVYFANLINDLKNKKK